MNCKTIEIRDRATFIPALAIQLGSDGNEPVRYLLSRAGFGRRHDSHSGYVILVRLNEQRCAWDPYEWGDRTMKTAHEFVSANWSDIANGSVVDVEYILGETTQQKLPERVDA
jgi:hypothetical protein